MKITCSTALLLFGITITGCATAHVEQSQPVTTSTEFSGEIGELREREGACGGTKFDGIQTCAITRAPPQRKRAGDAVNAVPGDTFEENLNGSFLRSRLSFRDGDPRLAPGNWDIAIARDGVALAPVRRFDRKSGIFEVNCYSFNCWRVVYVEVPEWAPGAYDVRYTSNRGDEVKVKFTLR